MIMVKPIKWTDEMLDTLRRLYPTTPATDIADELGCSAASVLNKARQLGLNREKFFSANYFYGRFTGKRRKR